MASKAGVDRKIARETRIKLGLPGPLDEAKALLAGDQTRKFEVILSCLRRGSYIETACRVAGISRQRFYQWCAMGNQGKAPYADFLIRLDQVQGEATMDNLDVIGLAAARGDWKAAAWRLERMMPALYGQRLELTERTDYDPAAPQSAEKVNVSRLSLKDKKALKALIAKTVSGNAGSVDVEGEEIQ